MTASGQHSIYNTLTIGLNAAPAEAPLNNHSGLEHWAFVEITAPWDAEDTIRAALQAGEATDDYR